MIFLEAVIQETELLSCGSTIFSAWPTEQSEFSIPV